jgi:hypothetical protein
MRQRFVYNVLAVAVSLGLAATATAAGANTPEGTGASSLQTNVAPAPPSPTPSARPAPPSIETLEAQTHGDRGALYNACLDAAQSFFKSRQYAEALPYVDRAIRAMEEKYESRGAVMGRDRGYLAEVYNLKGDALSALKRYPEAASQHLVAIGLLEKSLAAGVGGDEKSDRENLQYTRSRLISARYYGELAPLWKKAQAAPAGEAKAEYARAAELCYEILENVGVPRAQAAQITASAQLPADLDLAPGAKNMLGRVCEFRVTAEQKSK